MKASTVVPVFLFFIAASASPLQTTPIRHSALEDRARNTYTFKNCSPQDQQQLEDALDDMQTLAQAAVRYSEPTNPDPAFRAWFGDGDGVRITDQTINLRYEKFAAFKTNVPKKSVTLDCDREARCCSMSGSYVACSMAPGDEEVAFCAPFWRWHQKKRLHTYAQPAELDKRPIQSVYWPISAVVLHELMHTQYGARDIKADFMRDPWGKPIGKQQISAYGHLTCLRLAESDPSAARRNADCYAMFAVVAYFGPQNWVTDPTQLTSID